MLETGSTDYGPFASLVATAGAIVSATAALIMGFRRGAKWEPVEINVDRGPRRVASLLAAIGIVLIWSQLQNVAYMQTLVVVAIVLGVLTLLFLIFYGYLIQVFTYDKETADPGGKPQTVKIIGGRTLTPEAQDHLREKKTTIKKALKDAGYQADEIWTRESIGIIKQLFVVCYIGLTISGTIALTVLAIIVGLNTNT
jgi:hypothetical protein